ncbi:3'(2'),5'-bisphosphate nucleotidase CysQ [bacterium endosymbiont of Bathymodiolus sp. 5 South]|uniref:3'(2'),5'-bisphosphate nucleotidase CysQ n=1 Tax=bacterium endosymbiont of Bathymodiolus sp. 5 South TaxID=1181670 RepID=UPI0010BA455E|nr:3'(2'),5'-bisphosphate nucleotidase CysQ [bacterium endosymbiont of Bathymodiolus sp. 5 South]SHN94072.1 3'(2'),5'-bisphosphate nucleotidase [bacterium endosymbiont of Bathymodiolus sp. 5 South]VVH56982.1 3'(2'),5'-bisphosphate nucleotidase (EC [uncultured Gammaproteobacteria bacterium]
MAFDKILPQLIELTTHVGEEILSYYKNDLKVELKADETPLTIADQNAHQSIVDALSQLTPNIPILSEESDAMVFKQRSKWQEYWLIDPLDGTRDFIEQTGEFCICIAYIKNHQAIFGLVYAPLTHAHYYGFDNSAHQIHNNTKTRLKACVATQPLRVVTGHYSAHSQRLQAHLEQLGEHQLSCLGSALKFCKIAEGIYDYYPRFGPCCEWDTAAGACILQNAGGSVLDENGAPLRYNTKDDLLSPIFFASGIN